MSTDGGESWTNDQAPGYFIHALAVDPQSPSTIYAGAFGEDRRPAPPPHPATTPAVLKSADGGASWIVLYSGDSFENWPLSVIIDPRNSSTLYAYTPGILKSTEGGSSWSSASFGLPIVNALLIDPQTPATLYAGTNAGVFRSTDAGANWTAVNPGLTSLAVISLALDPQAPATLYAGTGDGGVFRISFE